MNEKNVAALTEAFDAMLEAWHAEDTSGVQQYDGPEPGFVARFLAQRGVLVPSVVTDVQAEQLAIELDSVPEVLGTCISGLEMIAKGTYPA